MPLLVRSSMVTTTILLNKTGRSFAFLPVFLFAVDYGEVKLLFAPII